MELFNLSYSIVIVALCFTGISAYPETEWVFPKGFLIGTATSAHQVEGAWNVSDKAESCWDRFTHARPDKILNKGNADVACDSYNKYKEDVQLVKQMGMDFYRFSVSWPRILPTGYANVVSKDGVRYYNELIDEVIKNGLMPLVTIYHWDLPQKFQDMGGWTNEAVVDWFGDYARVVYREFGDRVKIFLTINEPHHFCFHGYNTGEYAPGLELGRQGEYLCATNTLKANARAYHIYNDEFRARQNGIVGINLDCMNFFPKYKDDEESEEVAFQFEFDLYAHPIFSRDGDFPSILKERVATNSRYEGLRRSRLPVLSEEWIDYIKGSADFLGINHYTSYLVEPAPRVNYTVYQNDSGLVYSYDPSWPDSPSPWLKVVPEGFLNLLMRIKNKYDNVPVYVMENGISDSGTTDDTQRIEYLHLYMKAMLTAIKNGCNVKGYTVWSLLDSFEWVVAYTEVFGLYHVDFNDPNRTRTPKKSVAWIKNVVRTRRLLPVPEIKKFRDEDCKKRLGYNSLDF